MPVSILSEYVLNPGYKWLAHRMWPDWVAPNFITLLGGAFALAAGTLLPSEKFGWACLLFAAYTGCDNMDGHHARRTNQCSRIGCFLDHFIDGTCGNLVGFPAVFCLLLGGSDVGAPTAMYWEALHAYGTLWLAPHVHKRYTGELSLGSRLFGIDEAYHVIIIILGLAWRFGAPLYAVSKGSMEVIIQLIQVISLVWTCTTVASRALARPPRAAAVPKGAHAVTALYLAFWELGRRGFFGTWWWFFWVPFCGVVVWSGSMHGSY